jgi:uncharacterized damage-inducible protein DinB
MKRTVGSLAFLILLLLANVSYAQEIKQMLEDWERAKAYTKDYLDAMPEDGYSFRPAPEMKSFAEQWLHATDAHYELAQLAGGVKSPIAEGASFKSVDKSKTATIKMVMDGYDFVINNIKQLKPQQFQEKIKVFGKYEMTKVTLLNKLFEHQTHHRGQTTVYLHLKGAKTPDQKLF